MKQKVDISEINDLAIGILYAVWRGIDPDYKNKYRRDIWGIFEGNVVVCSRQCQTLKTFVTLLSRKMMAVVLGKNQADRDTLLSAMECGYDEDVLNLFRTQSSYLILMVREMNSNAREEFEKDYE